jgi:nicotinamidase-related amidase
MSFSPQTSVLLLIDLQERLMPAVQGADIVIANALKLASAARLLAIPVLATEQNPHGLGPSMASLRPIVEATLGKDYFDATRETAWSAFLPAGRSDFIVAGCEAHVCVLQTVMGLVRLRRNVRVVVDAIGSRTEANREAAARRAHVAGAELVTTEMVIFEWLETSRHPKFHDVLKIVR